MKLTKFEKVAVALVLGVILTTVAVSSPGPFAPWVSELISSKVMGLPSGKVMVGNSDGKAEAMSISGDVSISNAGVVSLAANTISSDDLASGSVLSAAIFNGTISSDDIASNAIESSQILDAAVTEAKLFGDNVDGVQAARIARAVYDVAEHGGTAGAHGLGVSLPAKALITRSWFYTVTQFVDAGSGTVALHCEDANNIYSAADVTGITVGTKTSGVQDNALANFTGSISAACEITATVATATQSAGKMIVFVEYVVVE